jgi:hypothetical protein
MTGGSEGMPGAIRQRLHRVPSASPGLRTLVGLGALAASIGLVARVEGLGLDRGRALAFVGAIAVIGVLLATTVLPQAAGAAAIVLLLLPLPTLGSPRTRDIAVELAVLAVLAVELTAWAADLRSQVRETQASILQRGAEIALAVLATATAAWLALTAADLGGPHGRAALLLGLAAVGGTIGLLAWRARSSSRA